MLTVDIDSNSGFCAGVIRAIGKAEEFLKADGGNRKLYSLGAIVHNDAELTRLVEGVSDYIGSANKVPDRQVSDIEDVKNSIGDPDDILGPIPKPEELKSEKDKFKDETLTETEDVEEVLSKEKMV